MKTIKTYILLFALGFSLFSCSNYTDGINENPNTFTSAPGDLLIGQAELTLVKISASNSSRYGGIFTDQFTGSERQYETVNNYGVVAGDFNDAWGDLYTRGVAQAKLANDSGVEAGDILLVGVSQIIEALLMGEAAALWGDIPYSTAFDYTNYPDPTYDTQQSVLEAVQNLLNDAITNVGDATVASVYGQPVFVGNGAKWAEVAHSLKARYYLITKDYSNALSEAQQGISSASASLLSSHEDATGARNMYWQFVEVDRSGYLTVTDSNLQKLLDGRRERLLTTPGDADRIAVYFDGNELNTSDDGEFAADAPFPIVSWIETKLIEAEAAQRTGGDATTPFNDVRDHLAATYGGDFPHSTASGNDLLAQILEEKYISLPGSLQIFHDTRRTNNLIEVPIKGIGFTTIPQRFYYPQIEINANDNFPGLIDLFTPTPVNN
ncbi:MAG: SusD/RagB family nutrient-binding outer membrane lipoprotein [Bacteroidota bacterium]